jgi:peptidoglycan/xylan/chitin deacetylase (PgdA/CDA1 family)
MSVAPGVAYFKDSRRRVVALSIDDGPDPMTTPKILDTLNCHESQATFFVISKRIIGNESIVKDIVRQGHELGNHLTEDVPSICLSSDDFENELLKAHSVLVNFSKPCWLRPGFGWYTHSMVCTAKKHGYQVALGTVFPFDTLISSSEFASEYILKNIFSGSIIVLHDTRDWGNETAKTLDMVLPKLLQRGYKVVTLSKLFGT